MNFAREFLKNLWRVAKIGVVASCILWLVFKAVEFAYPYGAWGKAALGAVWLLCFAAWFTALERRKP